MWVMTSWIFFLLPTPLQFSLPSRRMQKLITFFIVFYFTVSHIFPRFSFHWVVLEFVLSWSYSNITNENCLRNKSRWRFLWCVKKNVNAVVSTEGWILHLKRPTQVTFQKCKTEIYSYIVSLNFSIKLSWQLHVHASKVFPKHKMAFVLFFASTL